MSRSCFEKSGKCQCKVCNDTPGCKDGCGPLSTCLSRNGRIPNVCKALPTEEPTVAPTILPTVYIPFTVPLGGYCSKHVDCVSGSCFEKNGRCQCKVCDDTPGCDDGCGPFYFCQLRYKIPNTCKARPTEEPTVAPTSSPTIFIPFSVPLGGYCTKHNACRSRSCFQKTCQCNVCGTYGCYDGCEPTEICRLRTDSHNFCRERPT